MFEPGGQRQRPEVQVEEVLRGIGSGFNNVISASAEGASGWIILAVLVLLTLVWLAGGLYQVGPRERAALQFFGDFQSTEGPACTGTSPRP